MLGVGLSVPSSLKSGIGGVGRTCGYVLVPGVLVEPLGEHWAVFSPVSGETHLVNDTSVAIVDMMSCETPMSVAHIYVALAKQADIVPGDFEITVGDALGVFVVAGLVREVRRPRGAAP